MLILISPAKTLDFATSALINEYTLSEYLPKSRQLISKLKKLKPEQISKLMNISPKLGQINYERFREWNLDEDTTNSKQAVFAFKGDVYIGLDIDQFTEDDLKYTQDHLRILSGLHGILKPLDLIQAYRLEMGTKLNVGGKNNLYAFWGDLITKSLNKDLADQQTDVLVNLASDEYFKSINLKKLDAKVITPVFRDFKNGSYKFLSFYGKKARGMMTRFILKHRLTNPEDLKLFEEEGYYYNENRSTGDKMMFFRG
jgi:uncharacterized protein